MKKVFEHQISLFDTPVRADWYCKNCVCDSCLMRWSDRCPYGKCYDNHRAEVNPYDMAHPDEPPRTAWSDWKTDQAFWCRGGTFYPAAWCEHYVKYTGSHVESCLGANVQVFQDGYIWCSIIDSIGCEECYKRFCDRNG